MRRVMCLPLLLPVVVACSQPDFAESPTPQPNAPAVTTMKSRIVAAARKQIGRTLVYDSAYASLAYPGGDVDMIKGVCTDVVVRSLRASHEMDLQELVHEDMKSHFEDYPSRWRLKKPDFNIDHRRVPNLKKYFERKGYSVVITEEAKDYLPGDIVTCTVLMNRPHIMIVSDRKARDGTPLVIHNIGRGTREEDWLFRYPITGHFRIEEEDEPEVAAAPPEEPQPVVKKRRRVIHVYVALADNKHQGIAPVPDMLGCGDDPTDNLYWGARYGIKTFLKKSPKWTLVHSTPNVSTSILERCFFRYNSDDVLLKADAYRGSQIDRAVVDFLADAGGRSGADLVVYIGHNGLMEFSLPANALKRRRKGTGAIVLACRSRRYFQPLLSRLGARPALLTNGLMAPEAYTLEAALEGWIQKEPDVKIRERATLAYNKYQKCGIDGARRLFAR